ncbi:PREDICTED: histone-lysine N-methyltransferase SETDB2 [Nanorana parkeri]|uniref:histone-lysine N-methyltransferase SETDB2 n=1 Tax=Nanorana parkeri TaxID=125878 RepID=UPI0008543E9B|nr:PREDICTED: histone-lysine N-methyltransferase SETDB2 [Nanorana parkeri]
MHITYGSNDRRRDSRLEAADLSSDYIREDPHTRDSGAWEANGDIDEHALQNSKTKSFWLDQQAQGKVDIIFKKVEKKLRLLWQKIKDGSATDKEYSSAYLLVSEDVLLAQESYDCNKNTVELPKNEDQSPERCKEEVTGPDPDVSDTPLPFITQHVCFLEHTCRETCLSEVNPYFNRRGNPLRFPLLCQFHRWHAKSDLLSRQLDVIYKAPCGKSLRNYEDVHSYLFETKCHFLFLDYFSFNTFLQLERKPVTDPAVQEADISRDVELVPVSLCNEIDDTKPSPFTYRKSPWPRGYFVNNFTDLFIGCCDCTDGCLDVSTCTCLQLTAKAYNNYVSSPKQMPTNGYKYKRLQVPIPTGLYECNVSCKCDRRMCQNRVVQHGLQVRLQVYKTIEKGWGVRCLDDIDKGTFVCIYAGKLHLYIQDLSQILMNSSNVNTQDTSPCVKPASIFSKRKRPISLSDSEVTNPPPNSSSRQKPGDTRVTSGSSHQPKITIRNKISRYQVGNTGLPSVKRPKTKTAILQQRRRRLMEKGAVTVQHSSDEEEFVIPVSSPKPMHTSCLGHEGGDAEKTDAGYLSDNSTLSIQSTETQRSACKQKDALQHPESEENIWVLDASKEGNVARFLNHSCLPNLFVQPVFVETHSKKFPWVAFFTKSYLKAGTELTWDYNYNTGSVPEEEIPCLCGQKTCQNITV